MVLMSVKQIGEAFDNDLETNLSWIKKTFKVDDQSIKFMGQGAYAKIIVIPDPKILSEYNKDTTSDIKVFEQYKKETWDKIRLFSLYHFYFKHDRIMIGIGRKLEIQTIYCEPRQGIREENYHYIED